MPRRPGTKRAATPANKKKPRMLLTKFCAADMTAAQQIRRLIPKAEKQVRITQKIFRDLCAKNKFPFHEGFEYFLGRLVRSHYSPGTIKTYARYVWRIVKPTAPADLYSLNKAVGVYATLMRKEVVKVPPCGILKMMLVMARLTHIDDLLTCFFGLTIGLRPSDSQWLRFMCFLFKNTGDLSTSYYQYYLLFSKNHRDLSDRATSPKIPAMWSLEPAGRVKAHLDQNADSEEFIIQHYNYGRCYRELWKIQQSLGPLADGERRILPMDFRRHYINQVCKNKEYMNWTEYTLHKDPKVVRAHYQFLKETQDLTAEDSAAGKRFLELQ
jgi:hypothetical protein